MGPSVANATLRVAVSRMFVRVPVEGPIVDSWLNKWIFEIAGKQDRKRFSDETT